MSRTSSAVLEQAAMEDALSPIVMTNTDERRSTIAAGLVGKGYTATDVLGGATPPRDLWVRLGLNDPELKRLEERLQAGQAESPRLEPEPKPTSLAVLHIRHASAERLALSQNAEEEMLLAETQKAAGAISLERGPITAWGDVEKRMGEFAASAHSGQTWALMFSGHGGAGTFDEQPSGPECAAVICGIRPAPRLVVLNTCHGQPLAQAIHDRDPAVSVVFWEASEIDLTSSARMPALLTRALAECLATGANSEVEAVRRTNRWLGRQPFCGSLGILHQTRFLYASELRRIPSSLARVDSIHRDVSAAEVYEAMRQTRVLFSFGSARGGLDLACRLRKKLLGALGWGEESIYIDAMNLYTKKPGHMASSHHDTTKPFDPNAYAKKGAGLSEAGFLLNKHWAEYYYMGALVAHTIVLLFDPAWAKSEWCQAELDLFLRNVLHAYRADLHEKFPGSRFQLVVVYDTTPGTTCDGKTGE